MPFQCEFAISLLDDINPNNQLLRTLYSTLHLVPLPRFHSNPSWGDWTWQQRLFCSSFRWILFVVDLFIFMESSEDSKSSSELITLIHRIREWAASQPDKVCHSFF